MQKMVFLLCWWEDAIFLCKSRPFSLPDVLLSTLDHRFFPSKTQIWIKHSQNHGWGNNRVMSEDCWSERESLTNPSLSPPECRRFDDQARPSVITANMEDKQRVWDEKAKLWLHQRPRCEALRHCRDNEGMVNTCSELSFQGNKDQSPKTCCTSLQCRCDNEHV